MRPGDEWQSTRTSRHECNGRDVSGRKRGRSRSRSPIRRRETREHSEVTAGPQSAIHGSSKSSHYQYHNGTAKRENESDRYRPVERIDEERRGRSLHHEHRKHYTHFRSSSSRRSVSISESSQADSSSSPSRDSTHASHSRRHARRQSRSHSPEKGKSRHQSSLKHRGTRKDKGLDAKHKKRRREEKKETNHDERDDRRSVLTGKKIKLKMHKTAADIQMDANRKELLQFLNSALEQGS